MKARSSDDTGGIAAGFVPSSSRRLFYACYEAFNAKLVHPSTEELTAGKNEDSSVPSH
jgi:hypothetical protein